MNETTQYKYLGIILDQHLNLHEYLATVYKKASSRLKLLKRVRSNLTSEIAGKIYHSMIQPIVTYCPTVFLGLPTYQKAKIQAIQDRGKQLVCSKQSTTEWKQIVDIINEQIMIDVHKSIQQVSPPKFHSYFKVLNMERTREEMDAPSSFHVLKLKLGERRSNSKEACCLIGFRMT